MTQSKFSRFFHEASPEERKEVIEEAGRKAMEDQRKTQPTWRERFDEKFAGAIETDLHYYNPWLNDVKDFIDSLLKEQQEEFVRECEEMKMENTKEESDSEWFYGTGNNHALDSLINKYKK